jgi:hypothetical protein
MSLLRNIYLMCNSVVRQVDGTFLQSLQLIDQKGGLSGSIDIITDSPMIPGRAYEFRITGPFPRFIAGQRLSSNMIMLKTDRALTSCEATKLPPEIIKAIDGEQQ